MTTTLTQFDKDRQRWELASSLSSVSGLAEPLSYEHQRHVRDLVKQSIRRGELTNPKECSKCHTIKHRIVAHHDNYSEPFLVRWLCNSCHRLFHLEKGCISYELRGLLRFDNIIDERKVDLEPTDVKDLFKILSYRERQVIKLRFGFGSGKNYTLEEIGRLFKVTKQCIWEVESRALDKMQKMLC